MAFSCAQCGFRNNDIKAGGAIPTLGTSVTLCVDSAKDLARDVLKSDSAALQIPELELELQHGTLGGVYTTVEGLCLKILNSLRENNPFCLGDSSVLHHSTDAKVGETRARFDEFLGRLEDLASGRVFPFTLVIRDPLGNSFISARLGSFLPPEMDPNLKVEDFKRTWDEVIVIITISISTSTHL